MTAALFHLVGAQSDGHEYVGWCTKGIALRKHADDRVTRAAQRHLFANYVLVRGETSLPQAMTDDTDGICAGSIFIRRKAASQRGLDAEYVEELR